MLIDIRLLQYLKASSPIVSNFELFYILAVWRLLQFKNASPPMLVTLSGILIEVRLLHPLKAASPMLVTPLGTLIEVRLLQSLKALRPTLVNFEFFDMFIVCRFVHPLNVPLLAL